MCFSALVASDRECAGQIKANEHHTGIVDRAHLLADMYADTYIIKPESIEHANEHHFLMVFAYIEAQIILRSTLASRHQTTPGAGRRPPKKTVADCDTELAILCGYLSVVIPARFPHKAFKFVTGGMGPSCTCAGGNRTSELIAGAGASACGVCHGRAAQTRRSDRYSSLRKKSYD
ncbi:hypothetical protein EVAR_36249_1 [Eumeta japonica]|uniref:Uncharacterized protein n=1 Tax=Eumeta variegata TaxID=151549 RepID=A0A4C1WVH6_EUMVA|nr:hypothetical protein EVAR_36249_1 [Eumeta japonica]